MQDEHLNLPVTYHVNTNLSAKANADTLPRFKQAKACYACLRPY